MDWFLYDRDLRQDKVKVSEVLSTGKEEKSFSFFPVFCN